MWFLLYMCLCPCSAAFPTCSGECGICWNIMGWEKSRSDFCRLIYDDLIYPSSCNTIATSYIFLFGNQYGNLFCLATESWSGLERRRFRGFILMTVGGVVATELFGGILMELCCGHYLGIEMIFFHLNENLQDLLTGLWFFLLRWNWRHYF